jgi:hypothetical protein
LELVVLAVVEQVELLVVPWDDRIEDDDDKDDDLQYNDMHDDDDGGASCLSCCNNNCSCTLEGPSNAEAKCKPNNSSSLTSTAAFDAEDDDDAIGDIRLDVSYCTIIGDRILCVDRWSVVLS